MKPKKALLIEFLSECSAQLGKGMEETIVALPPQEVKQNKDALGKWFKSAQVLQPIKDVQDRMEQMIQLLKDE